MAGVPTEAHWRDSARIPRFFFIDARASFPLLLFLLHIRIWSFVLAILAMAFFALLERYGFSVTVFLRWIRSILAGPRKLSIPWWKE
jgi:intracellular multiplication protein IcmT